VDPVLLGLIAAPLVVGLLAAVWRGWRGAAAVAGALVLLALGTLAVVLLQPPPHTRAEDYGRGQSLVYLGGFTVLALVGVCVGGLIGLACRWLALRGRPPMLEVEHPIQTRGSDPNEPG
jgi:hypothetical protein